MQKLFNQPCFSGGIAVYVIVDLLCPWEKVSSGSSYAAILDPLFIEFSLMMACKTLRQTVENLGVKRDKMIK